MLTGNSAGAAEPEGAPLTPRNDPPMSLSAALTYTGGDRLLLAELLAIFVDEGPRHMRELREAASRADCGRLSHAAHTLKGELQVLGAEATANLAQRLETLGREGRVHGVGELLAALEPEVGRLLEFVAAELAGLAPVSEKA